MQTLNVALGERSYPIHIGCGLLSDAALITPHLKQKKTVVVSNTTVAPLYLARLMATLAGAGVSAQSVILPDGEQYKTWATL
ncbi:MAG: 3-dehydroquinate synthase, partial [Azonexus sp.]|nr:3-dehydroquinate synthase [Azonexus sp.]